MSHSTCFQLPPRTLVQLTGADRHKFLHSFCTAEINGLPPNEIREAFVLNEKGKVLSHVLVLNLKDRLLLSGAGNQATTLIEHLDKFIIRDDVKLEDLSANYHSLFVMGADAETRLNEALSTEPRQTNSVAACDWQANEFIIGNAEIAGFGYLILARKIEPIIDAIKQAGIQMGDEALLHSLRIEKKTPWFGVDIDLSNLPQELRRDDQAISFEKGCYLGQETVARIDSLGRVNRLFVGLNIESDQPASAGTELFVEEKVVGKLTTCAIQDGRQTGLAFVRSAHAKPGKQLSIAGGKAIIV